jgi:predicted GNAT family acetyltransferase
MQALVQHARDNGLKLASLCSYARAWSKRHPEANDVLS